MSKIKDLESIIQNENIFAVHCFSHKFNMFLSKSCDLAPNRNIFSISAKAFNYNQIVVNQNSKTGRNFLIDPIQMKQKTP